MAPLADTRQDLAAFDPALLRAMAADPRDRFGACLDFAAALRDAATAATLAQRVIDPAAHAPTEHLANPTTGSGLPEVFVAAWSAEDPGPDAEFDGEVEPEFAPTMAAAQLSDPDVAEDEDAYEDEDDDPTRWGRLWALTGVAALVALIVVLVVVVARGGSEEPARPTAAPPPSSSAQPAPEEAATTGVGGRPRPASVRGADPTGEECEGGFQVTGQGDGPARGYAAAHRRRASSSAAC